MLSFRSPFDPSSSICKASDYGYSHGWDSSAREQGTMILGCLTFRAVFPSRLPAASHQNSRKQSCVRFLSQHFCFPLSVSFHQCSIPIFIYMFLPEGQTGEAWAPSKSSVVPEIGERWAYKHLRLVLKGLTVVRPTLLARLVTEI
jgi:hypothetical protein